MSENTSRIMEIDRVLVDIDKQIQELNKQKQRLTAIRDELVGPVRSPEPEIEGNCSCFTGCPQSSITSHTSYN